MDMRHLDVLGCHQRLCITPCDILLRLRQWEPDCVRSPSAGRQLRLRRARFDSQGCQVDGRLRPRVEGAG